MAERIGFIGLGIMGAGMAANLIGKGHDVVVWNRTAARMDPLVEAGATPAASPAEVGRTCPIVMMCVSDTPDVDAVLQGDRGLLAGVSQDSLIVDHSTISPGATVAFSREVAALGGSWIDAPVISRTIFPVPRRPFTRFSNSLCTCTQICIQRSASASLSASLGVFP